MLGLPLFGKECSENPSESSDRFAIIYRGQSAEMYRNRPVCDQFAET